MKTLTNFATADHPLRASSIGDLVRCALRGAMKHLQTPARGSGPAADTGSACHAMIAAFHQGSSDPVAEGEARVAEYPLADMSAAARMFRKYALDPRNASAKVVACEEPLLFSVPSETGEIFIQGTPDQIREESGSLKAFDVKTGDAEDGFAMTHTHAFQISAYCVGASLKLGRPVEPGAIIRVREYLRRGVIPQDAPGGVFWNFPFDHDGAQALMRGVARVVDGIRRGKLWAAPGDYCRFCPLGGISSCASLLP